MTYIIQSWVSDIADADCQGWECEEVSCPDGYAVRLPTGEYLPCDQFNEFVVKKNRSVLLNAKEN